MDTNMRQVCHHKIMRKTPSEIPMPGNREGGKVRREEDGEQDAQKEIKDEKSLGLRNGLPRRGLYWMPRLVIEDKLNDGSIVYHIVCYLTLDSRRRKAVHSLEAAEDKQDWCRRDAHHEACIFQTQIPNEHIWHYHHEGNNAAISNQKCRRRPPSFYDEVINQHSQGVAKHTLKDKES